jgi:hypothetical protein
MSVPDFLLDEHITPVIQSQLAAREPGIHILAIGQPSAPPKGTPDPELLRWIEQHGYLLVTANRASMPAHLRAHLAAGHHVPGILILPRQWDLGRVLDELQLIWAATLPGVYRDPITYLAVRR